MRMRRSFTPRTNLFSLALGGLLFAIPGLVSAAEWITPAASDTHVSPWVTQVEDEFSKAEHALVFTNDPRTPMAAVVHLLNQAADALNNKNEALAKDFVRQSINILQRGVQRGYYGQGDLDPVKKSIMSHIPEKIRIG